MNGPESPRVLVTGGNRGIGRAIAERFREQRYDVRTPTRADLDLSSRKSVTEYVARGGAAVDILINNAGENRIGRLAEVELADWDHALHTNLTGPMILSRAAAEHMAGNGWGRIVNISSCYSMVSRPGRAPYSAAKAGLNGLTRAMALEYAVHGVLVNALCPGFVETDMTTANNTAEQIAALCRLIPLGRLARPEEVARWVYSLGSTDNTYITGQTIVLDGGFLIQ